MDKPIRVTKRNPCPICEKPDWCTLSADGTVAFCMRISSDRKASNGSFIHVLADPKPPPAPLSDKHEWVDIPDWSEKAIECYRHPKAESARKSIGESLGLSQDVLEALLVGWSADRRGEFTTWPEKKLVKGQVQIIGIDRRYDDGAKKCMKGGKRGMYFVEHWWVAPGPVLLPEGGSDAAALIDAGCCAVGRFACRGGIGDLAVLSRRFIDPTRRMIVLGDDDDDPSRRGRIQACPIECTGCGHCCPGRMGAIDTASELSIKLSRHVEPMYIFYARPQGTNLKDARDCQFWESRSMPELIENLIPFTKEPQT